VMGAKDNVAPPGQVPNADQIRAARAFAAAQAEQARLVADIGPAGQRLSALLTVRRHLIEQARDAAETWAVRCDHLTAIHARGFASRRRGRHPAQVDGIPVLPHHIPRLPWIDGDLPLLATTIEPRTSHVVEWAMREFDGRSDRQHVADPAPAARG
jgi:hypothetical protein